MDFYCCLQCIVSAYNSDLQYFMEKDVVHVTGEYTTVFKVLEMFHIWSKIINFK